MEEDEAFDPLAVPEGVTIPDVFNMPDEIKYFFVVPKPPSSNCQGVKANAITFREFSQTFENLMDVYFQEYQSDASKSKIYTFWLGNGFQLDASLTIRDLQKMLGRQNVDGVVLYLNLKKIVKKGIYDEECCLLDYFGDKNGKLLLKFNVFLQGCKNSQTIYLNYSLKNEQDQGAGNEILKELSQKIQSQLGVTSMNVKRISEATIITPDNKLVKFQRFKRLIQQKIYNGSTINIKLTNPHNIQMKRVRKHEYNSFIAVFKEHSTEGIKFKFDDIANMIFQDFYTNSLHDKASSKKKQVKYCLKIMDIIIKPDEKISKAEAYFKNENSREPLVIVAKVINEKMIFFDFFPPLAQTTHQFHIRQLLIPQNQRKIKQQCIRKSRQVSRQSKNEYFKIASNIEPITIYTSQLKYQQLNTKIQAKIYQSLNKYLRNISILSINQNQFITKDWRIKYTSTLLRHLSHVQKYKGKVWRGINVNPQIKQSDKGNIFTFKSFTSTSTSMESAIGFAKYFAAKQPFHLFSLQVKNGKNIQEYSLRSEGEILLEPYTEFQLIKINNIEINGHKYLVYDMQERETTRQMPKTRANFIIYIDDQSDKPDRIFQKIKKEAAQNTIFERLRSTRQLQTWLSKHKKMLLDETANILFITNMIRREGQKINKQAGIQGAVLIRKESFTVPIFFCVEDTEDAINKLTDNKFRTANVMVSNNPEHLQAFLNGFL